MQLLLYLIWLTTPVCFLEIPGQIASKPLHGIYLSVVQIDHSEQEGEARVLIKVFTDDLQNVLRAAYAEKCRMVETGTFVSANSSQIESYFQTHFLCDINENPVELHFVSGTQENDVYWLKFSIHGPSEWRHIQIKAPFFMEIYSDQSNIIQILEGNEKRFARLTRGADQANFTF